MPVTKDLKLPWYDTQNIHLCTVKDFENLTNDMMVNIEEGYGIDRKDNVMKKINWVSYLNLFAAHAVFLVSK